MIMRIIAALFLMTFLATIPLSGSAQTIPSYAQPEVGGDAQIRGRIASFDNAYNLKVRDEKGYVDNVELHPGTIINPVGLTLVPGMVVSVLGYNAGTYFAANEINTPYVLYGAVPYFAGHPWFYYGPTVSLTFFFGHAGWWHGPGFVGGFHYLGGVRVYDSVHVGSVYHGGSFHGRDYVARRVQGGYYLRGAHGISHH
jgi:hypothetical protein